MSALCLSGHSPAVEAPEKLPASDLAVLHQPPQPDCDLLNTSWMYAPNFNAPFGSTRTLTTRLSYKRLTRRTCPTEVSRDANNAR